MIKLSFLIAFCIIMLLIMLSFIKSCPIVPKTSTTYKDIEKSLKTGDIILAYGCNMSWHITQRTLLRCDPIHTMFVWRFEGDLYVIDLAPSAMLKEWLPFRGKNVKIRPLHKRLQKYDIDTFVLIPAPYEVKVTQEDINKWNEYLFDYFFQSLFKESGKYKVCSNFVAMILEEKGLPIPTEKSYQTTPCDFYDNPNKIFFKL